MTGIKDPALAKTFMAKMAPLMSRVNDDGIGYTAVKGDGELFSQRWLKNHQFFDTSKVMTAPIAKKLAVYAERLPTGCLNPNYSEYGTIDFTDIRTVTMHTRFATCGKEFANTHPFIYNDTSLIHNGGISNAVSLGVNKISTCDSEAALQTYLSTGVAKDVDKAQDWLDQLSGRWAFGVLARDRDGRRILDVVRGFSFLYYMEVPGIGRIFTTDADDAKAVVRDLKLEFTQTPFLIESNSMYRYDALNGEFLSEPEIDDSILNAPVKTTSEIYYGGRRSVTGTWDENGEFKASTTDEVTKTLPSESQMNAGNGYSTDDNEYDEYADLKDASGAWDKKKVRKFVDDESIDFLERLSVWDEIYDTDITTLFMAMSADQMNAVEEKDFREGFFAARKFMLEMLAYGKKKA